MTKVLSGWAYPRRRLLPLAALALLLAAAMLLLARGSGSAGAVAKAGPPPPSVLDHFLCYKAKFKPLTGGAIGAEVGLNDQFQAKTHRVGFPKWFCNPTNKQHEGTFPIINPNNHLTAYKLSGRTPGKKLHVINQFQDAVPEDPPNLVTDKGPRKKRNKPLLLVPTQKGTQEEPSDIDHFKCYKAKKINRSVVNTTAFVADQFGSGGVEVQRAKFLCNPVDKVHGLANFPAQFPDDHLVCYSGPNFEFPSDQRPKYDTISQFGDRKMIALKLFMICAPSDKFELD